LTLRGLPALRGLALCILGGVACSLLNTPLPWMIGPLLAMAAAKLFGAKVDAPQGGRQVGQLIIGCALGLYFTPVVAHAILTYAGVMLLAAAMTILMGYICGFFLAKASGIDMTTALFASTPGGASEMAVLGERYGAALDKVALAQSTRILMVVVIIPAVLTYWGVQGADPYQPTPGHVSYPGLALLLLLSTVGGWVLSRFRMPNAWMLGPLFVSIAVTVTETGLSAMPGFLTNGGQLLIGCALGSRFEQGFIKGAPRYLVGVVATIGLALALSALFGLALAYLGEIAVPTMILATAPGGIAEMSITAKVLRLGVPLVTAFHVTRIILLVTTTAPIFSVVRRMAVRFRQRASSEK
jgi:uncharacterized protein